MKRSTLGLICGLSLATTGVVGISPTAPATAADTYDEAVTKYVMERDGVSASSARAYLDRKDAQLTKLKSVEKSVPTDGTYFADDTLVVVVDTAAQAAKVRTSGLTAKVAPGQRDLAKQAKETQTKANAKYLLSYGPDLAKGTVTATVTKSAPASVIADLRQRGITVERGETLQTYADVVPGQIMDLDPGSNCSLGYPGKTADGNNVLLTAGHCVESLPRILDKNGTKIGVGTKTRFKTNSSSVDMGLVDIDAEDTGRPYVDSRGHSGNKPIRGMSSAPIGTEICKAGNTTGWTCGKITNYGQTVNYGATTVSGLARATVCSEGGDSGGAYISGDKAQGMTSGGPRFAECGFNGGNVGSYSFYQPVVDAAKYYGVTLTTQ